jgi:hypothetical protein
MVTAKKHGVSIAIGILSVLLLLFDTSLPREITDGADSITGKVFMALLLVGVFYSAHPIAGVLAILALWKLSMNGSSDVSNTVLFEEQPSDEQRPNTNKPSTGADDIPRYNNAGANVSADIGGTLEEEVVANMAPVKKSVAGPPTETYVPVLDTSITASEVPMT